MLPALRSGNELDATRVLACAVRVFDRYLSGWTIGAELDRSGGLDGPDDRRRACLEAAVIDLLHDDRGSPAVEHSLPRAA